MTDYDIHDGGPRFVKVYAWTIEESSLGAGDLGLLAILMRYADWTTGTTTVGLERLSADAGWTPKTTRTHLDTLEAAGAIVRHARSGETSTITILATPREGGNYSPPPREKSAPPQGVSTVTPPPKTPHDLDEPDIPTEVDSDRTPVVAWTNPWWDALVEIFGDPGTKKALMGKMARTAQDSGPPELIPLRANIYIQAFRGAALTLPAFLKHWEYLGSRAAEISTMSPAERKQAKNKKSAAQMADDLMRRLDGNE